MRTLPSILWVIALTVVPLAIQPARAAAPFACTEQVADGGFEAGGAAWQTTSLGGYVLLSQLLPYTGQWGAYLGGYNNANDELAQIVSLPAGAAITLRLWWQATTEETTHPWDTLDATLTPAGGGTATRLLRLSDDSVIGSWQQATLDLSAYAGQTWRLAFRARTDDNRPTDFYLDDISIEACGAATVTPTPTATTTPTETPSPTATPTVTPTVTSTPTVGKQQAYLPLIVR